MSHSAPAGQPAPASVPDSRGHHDWHSAQYVQEWVAQYEAQAESRAAQFDLLVDLIPAPEGAAVRILDVGAGWGPLTRHVLARLPAARAVLLDFSEAMLAEARRRLAGVAERVDFVSGDLSRPGAIEAALRVAGGPFDAVVSSLCVHNLRPTERVPALFGEICAALAPGGCFLDLDLMGAGAPAVQEAWHRTRVGRLRRARLAETGTLPSFEAAQALLRAQGGAGHAGHGRPAGPRRDARSAGQAGPAEQPPSSVATGGPGELTRTLLDHLLWLRQAGFEAVECFWRQDGQALIGAFKA
jgi:SAM-dependent methyltransferase